MVHGEVIVFSKVKLTIDLIEQLFDKIFYNQELGDYTVDGFAGINIFYLQDQDSTYSKGP